MSASALPRVEPETVGLSSARLRRLGEALRRDIDAAQLPGAVVAIARAGKIAHLEAVGYRDAASREPLKADAVFSIASMTKAMTSTAIMTLVEEGRVLLGDPVAKYLPPLAELKVMEASGTTRAPKQPPTIQDLLRHTSGLTYRDRGTTPAHALYPGSSIWAAERMSKDDAIAALAKSPLLFDPGSNWEYGFSTDVLGFVVEAVTGKTLGSVLQERVWGPLGMSRHRLRAAGRQARPLRAGAAEGPGHRRRQHRSSITPPTRRRSGSRAAAGRCRRPPTICALPRCCARAASWARRRCSGAARWR